MDYITPDRVAAVYAMWRHFPPFNRWKLPEADEIEFRTSDNPHLAGWHRGEPNGKQVISISCASNGHFDNLAWVVAHEMIHLRQRLKKTDNKNIHNAEFRRIARRVCLRYGWDFKRFV